jgi:hypothetical protein
MEENSKGANGVLEKLAMITDATQQIFPNGKSLIIFELETNDFTYTYRIIKDSSSR